MTDVGNLNLFLQWNSEDPVSPLEDQRNSVISGVQGDRNPFIDNPYLATLIWGGPNAENRWDALSNSDFSIKEISMYPNPTNNNFVYFSSSQDLKVIIYDVLGKQVIIEKISADRDFIDVSSLHKGIYLVGLISEDGSITKKLIKN